MSKRLEGKIALVTGGSTGLGFATAKRFAEEGAHVYITGRRQAELDNAVAAIGHDVTAVRADASKLDELDRLYETIQSGHGRLDVLFANAGGGEFAPLGAITEEHYNRIFDTNVKGLLFTVQKALPLLVDGASIILNASITSIQGLPSFSVYAASKAAVRSFARGWAADLRERRIRVNALSPGAVPTPAYDKIGLAGETLKNFEADWVRQTPLGRFGRPDEIAAVALFLASDESSFVNAVELYVDGGMSQI